MISKEMCFFLMELKYEDDYESKIQYTGTNITKYETKCTTCETSQNITRLKLKKKCSNWKFSKEVNSSYDFSCLHQYITRCYFIGIDIPKSIK